MECELVGSNLPNANPNPNPNRDQVDRVRDLLDRTKRADETAEASTDHSAKGVQGLRFGLG